MIPEAQEITIHTTIRDSQEATEYLEAYAKTHASLTHTAFNQCNQPGVGTGKAEAGKMGGQFAKDHGLLKRTGNSIVHNVCGRIKALYALKETEAEDLKWRIEGAEGRLQKAKDEKASLQPRIARNDFTMNELRHYRRLKAEIHQLESGLAHLKSRLRKTEDEIANRKATITWGSKKFARKEHHLEENGFSSREAWSEAFDARRYNQIYYLGSKDEMMGNQMCRITLNAKGLFDIRIRKEKEFVEKGDEKYVCLRDVVFPYRGDELAQLIGLMQQKKTKQALTFRFIKRKGRWYIYLTFSVLCPEAPFDLSQGALGVDTNTDHLAVCEVAPDGNIKGVYEFPIPQKSRGQNDTEISRQLNRIIELAKQRGLPIICENLNFRKKAAGRQKGKTKRRKALNHKLSSFAFRKVLDGLKFKARLKGIPVIQVNPAYTTRNGKKLARNRKLTGHCAAACMIARKALFPKKKYKK